MQPESADLAFDFQSPLTGWKLRSVTAVPAEVSGRWALRVALTDAVAATGRPGVDFVDMPTFALAPIDFRNGVISVDILSRLTGNAPDYARAFAGLAYRVAADGDGFEAVYLRPLNGRKVSPPPPRDKRAIQYFAYPDWKFDRLREVYPDGPFEAGLDIGPGEWTNLRIEVAEEQVVARVNGQPALGPMTNKAIPVAGAIGLWVDIGTEAYFSNLTVTRTT